MPEDNVKWSRVKEILDRIMERWERRHGRRPFLKEIHGGTFTWDTPQQLANCVTFGYKLIEPGKPGRETNLVRSLVRGFGTIPMMPLHGPYLNDKEIDEIIRWIDAGMPED